MKKVLIIMFTLLLSFMLISCDEKTTTTVKTVETYLGKMDCPENVSIEGKVLTWDEVDNARGYILFLNGKRYITVYTNSYDFTYISGEQLIFQVRTEAPKGYEDSDLSESVEYIEVVE